MKLVIDSWGKLPSGILEGNFHEYGSFTECLNLMRNGQTYKSQYCMATITAKLEGWMQGGMHPQLSVVG